MFITKISNKNFVQNQYGLNSQGNYNLNAICPNLKLLKQDTVSFGSIQSEAVKLSDANASKLSLIVQHFNNHTLENSVGGGCTVLDKGIDLVTKSPNHISRLNLMLADSNLRFSYSAWEGDVSSPQINGAIIQKSGFKELMVNTGQGIAEVTARINSVLDAFNLHCHLTLE